MFTSFKCCDLWIIGLNWSTSPVMFSVHRSRRQTNLGSLSSVIRSLPQRVATTPRAASAAERTRLCRRSETSCRAHPRCSARKVSVSVCDSARREIWFFLTRIMRVKSEYFFQTRSLHMMNPQNDLTHTRGGMK